MNPESERELVSIAQEVADRSDRLGPALAYCKLLAIVHKVQVRANYSRAAVKCWEDRKTFQKIFGGIAELAEQERREQSGVKEEWEPEELAQAQADFTQEATATALAEARAMFEDILASNSGNDLTVATISQICGVKEDIGRRWYAARKGREPIAKRRTRLGREMEGGTEEQDTVDERELMQEVMQNKAVK